VLTPGGANYYWSDRPLRNMTPVIPPAEGATVSYLPWLMGSGSLRFNRSLQTDTGTLRVQNVSGNVLVRDFEAIMSKAVLDGSLYVFRYFDVAAQWAWIEQHGTLSVGDAGDSVQLNLVQLFSGQDDTPAQTVSETCQLSWGYPRCGATGDTECLYTFASCQVVERFVGIQTAFETNNPATVAALADVTINRTRAW
jgi:hypothetical protein